MSEHKKRKKSLFENEDVAEGATGQHTELGIRVNKDYAARFEHNKRREELHRLQSKYPEEAEKLARKIAREAAKAAGEEPRERPDEDFDSSEDEEEDEGEIPADTEAKIFDTLLRIRNQDPSIYRKDVVFFDDADEEDQEDEGGGATPGKERRKDKAMYLKDLIAKQALEYGPGGDSSDEDAPSKKSDMRHPKAYDKEQENLRKAFLEAAVEVEDRDTAEELGGVLRLRSRTASAATANRGAPDEDAAATHGKRGNKGAKEHAQKTADGQFQKLIEAYFGTGDTLDPNDKFLKEYIVNKGWVDREDDYVPSYQEVVGDDEHNGGDGNGAEDIDDEEDERYLREVDAFEAKYNFRFEEPGADRIITHPRNVEGTVRKPDDKRKRQRDAKKQRLEEAEEAAQAELKRLKNLKKQEIENKLDKLRHVAGAAAPAAVSLDDMLEGDFDPEEWDKKMAEAFDDSYYEAEEDLEDLRDDLDLDLLSEDIEEEEEGDGAKDKPIKFSTIQKKLKELDAVSDDPEGDNDGRKRPADPEVLGRQRAELQRLLEEYYKLDYEDNVGGIKTRFRYKEVPANTFGLSVDDILRLEDKALNQVAGMKRLAPYREDASKQRPNYKALEMIKGESVKGQRRQNKKREWKRAGEDRRGGHWRSDHGGAAQAAGAGAPTLQAAGADEKPHSLKQEVRRQLQQEDKGRSDQNLGAAGPGPRSEAAAGRKGHGNKPRGGLPQPVDGQHGRQQGRHAMIDPQRARLASYAVPTLKKDSGGPTDGKSSAGKKRKRQDQAKPAGQENAPSDGPQLTRAQRKNFKRSQKRANKRGTENGGAAQ